VAWAEPAAPFSRYFPVAFVGAIHELSGWVHVFSKKNALQGRPSRPICSSRCTPLAAYLRLHLPAGHALPFVVLIMATSFLFSSPPPFLAARPGGFLLAVVAIHLAFCCASCFRP